MTAQKGSSKLALFLKIGLPILIIALGAASAVTLVKTKPTAKRTRAATATAPLVRTVAAEVTTMPVRISAAGTVRAAREIALKPRVAGRVETMAKNFTPGGVLRKGDTVLKLDPRDLALVVAERKAEVTKAEADLELEMGQQHVAREEWKHLLGEKTLKTALALRKPQLAQAKASLEAAKAALQKAQLELSRTTVRAPFNALVSERKVDVGSQVSTSDALATLSGTDEYWIEISVPMDRLRRIDLPGKSDDTGSVVQIQVTGGTREGKVLRLLGSLKEDSRMAQVLVSVPDPLNLVAPDTGTPPLILGDYVTVTVLGRQVRDAVRISRKALREGDTVWIAENNKLHVLPVNVIWKDRSDVFLAAGSVEPGAHVVVSGLSGPVEGMALRLEGTGLRTKGASQSAPEQPKGAE